MKVLLQIGYRKAVGFRKEGQLIRTYVDDEECTWGDGEGIYLTPQTAASKGILWYMWRGEVHSESTIRICVNTSLVKIGPDEDRTFESLYFVEESAPEREVIIPGVGYKNYPLIKGRITEVASVSKTEERVANIDGFLKETLD